jgi:hypothetical protein
LGDLNITEDIRAVRILPGSVTGLTARNDGWNQDSDGVPSQSETGDSFGLSLAAGDFNDDGYMDLAIGVPYEDLEPIEDAGSIRILNGSAVGLTANGEGWNQDSGGILGAAEEGDLFGLALAAGSWCGEKHWIYIPLVYR